MAHAGTPVRVVLAGWGFIFLFAVLLMLFGAGELVFGALHGLVAVIMATWVWRRGSRLALIVSLALGLLLGIRQAAYIAGDVTGRHIDAGTLLEDVIGLAGGLLLVAGAAAALLRRSRNRSAEAAGQMHPVAPR